MAALELRVVPPVVALLSMALGYGLGLGWPGPVSLPFPWVIGLSWMTLGLCLAAWAGLQFRRAKTTVHPMNPGQASTLVTSGVFAWTRNPMYLGLTLLVFGMTWLMGQPAGLLAALFTLGYLDRFQVVPEERALIAKLGEPYQEYLSKVRRWM